MRRGCSRLLTAMTQRIVPLIQLVALTVVFELSAVRCVPMKYEIGYRNSIDLDAEQTEARYDQGMLSDIMNDDRVEMQKAESCMADNFKYDHGQKIQRYDPCEICLCIDGEIFCWWKQCDIPSTFGLSDSNPLGASRIQSITPTAKTTSPVDTIQPQLPAAAVAVSPLSSSTTTLPRKTEVATSTARPKSSPAAPPSYPDQPDNSVRILHPQPLENIPQNILSFPQSPPIMMYRPMVGKNLTSSSVAAATAKAAERNKHSGPLKKANPLHFNNGGGKKPYRKSKSKGYTINFSHIDDRVAQDEGQRAHTVTEGIAVADGGRIVNDVPHGYGEERSGSRFPIAGSADADGDDDEEEEDDDENDDDDDDDDEAADDDDSEEAEGRSENNGASRSQSGSGVNNDGNFGGYGYGMIKEAEEDKQQHYIITSSGHVEMFDDTSMEVTENAFGMNRLPSQQDQQQQQLTAVTNTTTVPAAVAQGDSSLEHFEQQATSSTGSAESSRAPQPPLITMTTNVTQNSNYSTRLSDSASGGAGTNFPLTPYAPLTSGSIIDVLNSTVDGGDYLDDNQTELIYPAVPGLSGNSGGSTGRQIKTTGATITTQSSATAGGKPVPEQHCVVMGVSYKVGSVLKQETGNCLHCVCIAGPENDPIPRVTCTPLNCPPLILPDILDGAGF